MRALVVFCHPVPDSFGAHLSAAVVDELTRVADTTVIDLYAGQELPAAFDGGTHAETLSTTDTLVLVYPTWWSSLPAPLMAWLEEALDRAALTGVRRVVAVTTHGSSRFVNAVSGGIGRRIIRHGLRSHLAPGAGSTFVALYSMDRIDDERRRRFVTRARRAVRRAAASAG